MRTQGIELEHGSQLVANRIREKALYALKNTALFGIWYQVLFPAPDDLVFFRLFTNG
nr:MAG TPA: hypothetical protein [Caudoviricetes sp.]